MQAVPAVIPTERANPDADTRLREFARQLAKIQALDPPSRHQKSDLLERLQSWEQALRNANAIFKGVPSKDLPVSRAAEWMLDNFYVVKQTFNQITEGLPSSFLDQLPEIERNTPGIRTTAPRARTGTTALAIRRVVFCLPSSVLFEVNTSTQILTGTLEHR